MVSGPEDNGWIETDVLFEDFDSVSVCWASTLCLGLLYFVLG